MSAGIWVGILILAVALATTAWRRAMNGKPRAFWILMGTAVASDIWYTATNGVLTGTWVASAIGLMSALIALTMFAARHSR